MPKIREKRAPILGDTSYGFSAHRLTGEQGYLSLLNLRKTHGAWVPANLFPGDRKKYEERSMELHASIQQRLGRKPN